MDIIKKENSIADGSEVVSFLLMDTFIFLCLIIRMHSQKVILVMLLNIDL